MDLIYLAHGGDGINWALDDWATVFCVIDLAKNRQNRLRETSDKQAGSTIMFLCLALPTLRGHRGTKQVTSAMSKTVPLRVNLGKP